MSRIETGQMDRVEILLNPGSYLRVAENSIVRINETKLDNVRVALDKGTVIVESAVFDKKVHALRIETAAGEIAIQKEGLYRFEADPEQTQWMSLIRRGKAQWLPEGKPQVTLKSGKRFQLPVSSAGGELQYANIRKEQVDNLDNWSMRRAQYLVAASDRSSSWASNSWYSSYASTWFSRRLVFRSFLSDVHLHSFWLKLLFSLRVLLPRLQSLSTLSRIWGGGELRHREIPEGPDRSVPLCTQPSPTRSPSTSSTSRSGSFGECGTKPWCVC